MNMQNWWDALTKDVKNAFTLVEEGGGVPVRWNVRAIWTCVFRVGLYLVGLYLAYSGLISAPFFWGLAPFLANIAGNTMLLLALVGLFFFFRWGLYHRGLKRKEYLEWIFGNFFSADSFWRYLLLCGCQ